MSEFWGSRRLRAEEGIKPARKDFATRWWARRWLEALSRLGGSGRLERGRTYARAGQVLSYEVTPGEVKARVQGSRKKPYEVTIRLQALPDEAWEAVLEALSSRAAFAAALLAGEMPEDVEEAFSAADAGLMPRSPRELSTDCSCPDWANPCKHVAAVHYLLADAFDDDPFLMFRLRGRGREALMEGLRARRPDPAGPVPEEPPPEPLPEDSSFWRSPSTEVPALDFTEPSTHGAVLLRLGAPPGIAPEELRRALEPALREMARRARAAAED